MNAFEESFPRAVPFAQSLIAERIGNGDVAVDATVGNGHDTRFLAQLVGKRGKVLGFDLQAKAIDSTRSQTKEFEQVQLHQTGHEHMADFLDQPIKGCMFNLGYLPGGARDIITRPDSTIAGMKAASKWLAPGGLITVVIYLGHEGGTEESDRVSVWCAELPQEVYTVIEYRFCNQKNTPPYLLAIEKRNG